MNWTNDEVLLFIENYKRERLIWDGRHPSNRNKSEVIAAWNRIRMGLDDKYSVEDLKRKKESLMTSYRSAARKKLETGYEPSWYAFAALETFLADIYVPPPLDNSGIIEEEYLDEELLTGNETENELPQPKYRVQRTPAKKRSRTASSKKCEYIYVNTQNSEETESPSYVRNVKHEMDEVDLYCSLLAKRLRKLNEQQLDIVMHEIDNLVYRVKMSKKTRLLRGISPSPSKSKSPVFIASHKNEYMDDSNSGDGYSQDPIV